MIQNESLFTKMKFSDDKLGGSGWGSHYKRVNSSVAFEKYKEYNTNETYIKRILKFGKNVDRSLEFGSGKGGLSLVLKRESPKTEIHLLDLDKHAIEFSKKLYAHYNLNAKFHVNSFLDLPFEDEYFDFIHGNTALEHVKDTNQAVSELTRVLRKGGHILVTVPNSYRKFDGNDLYHTISRIDYYNGTFFPKDLKKFFENNSCEIVDYFGRGLVYHYPSYLPRYFAEKIRQYKNKKIQNTKSINGNDSNVSVYNNNEKKLYKLTFNKLDQLWDPVQIKLNNFVNNHEVLPPWMNLVVGIVAKKQ